MIYIRIENCQDGTLIAKRTLLPADREHSEPDWYADEVLTWGFTSVKDFVDQIVNFPLVFLSTE